MELPASSKNLTPPPFHSPPMLTLSVSAAWSVCLEPRLLPGSGDRRVWSSQTRWTVWAWANLRALRLPVRFFAP